MVRLAFTETFNESRKRGRDDVGFQYLAAGFSSCHRGHPPKDGPLCRPVLVAGTMFVGPFVVPAAPGAGRGGSEGVSVSPTDIFPRPAIEDLKGWHG